VKLLEELIFAAVGAVPVQVRHPRDLLVAGHQGTCRVAFADGFERDRSRCWHDLALIRGISDGVSPRSYSAVM
jgi:hypothetical protein